MPTSLGEVSDEMATSLVISSQHIEMKRLNIIVQRLVVKEEFCQQTQVLTVDLGSVAIHLKHRQVVTTVDFIARRTTHVTFLLKTQTSITSANKELTPVCKDEY